MPLSPDPTRGGVWLVVAAGLFFVSWLLMPGVGITDAARILELVAAQRGAVRLSVAAQLASSVAYAPALLALARIADGAGARTLRLASVLLLIGAMGSAADAIFHLLAYEMAAPGTDRAEMVAVMERMQGPGLRLIVPLILCFFAGSIALALGAVRARLVSRGNPALLLAALAIALGGGLLAARAPALARPVGLAVLALVSLQQAWVGLALERRPLPSPP